jgi:Ca-activated chloride channel family protein
MARCIYGLRFVLALSLILTLCAHGISQEQRYVLAVDVELVNVTAMVIDSSGKYVDGLTPGDFRVLEDGREQKISFFTHETKVPVSIGVIVDISGSHQYKLLESLQTVAEIASTLARDDEMFVITFNSRATVRQKFTNNAEEIQRALRDLRAGGETAVYDAISLGVREMNAAKNPKRVLILLSDCFDTRSKLKPADAEDLLKRSDTLAYAIGIDDDDGDLRARKRPRYHIYEYMLNRLTSAGGGRLIRIYTGQANQRRLAQVLLGELRQEYTLGYYPATGPENEGSRTIEVQVATPGARVLGQKLHLQRR